MRQPVERVDSAQAALAVILMEPSPSVPETAFATGYLAGSIAGAMFTAHGVFMTSSHAAQHEQWYATTLRPLSLVAALSKHRDLHDLEGAGWLDAWRQGTVGARHAEECVSCGRRLFDGLDAIHYCRVDEGIVTCFSDCADDYCRRDDDDRAEHLAACFDEIGEPDCTDAVEAVS